MQIYFIIFPIIINIIFLFICKNNNILLNKKIEKHKKFTSVKKNYSIGGTLIYINILFYHFFYSKSVVITLLFLSVILLLGLFSDLKILNNPKIRFLLQALFLYIVGSAFFLMTFLNSLFEIAEGILKFITYVIAAIMIVALAFFFLPGFQTAAMTLVKVGLSFL